MKETRALPATKAFCFGQRTFNTNLAMTPPRTPICTEVYRLQDSSALGRQWHTLTIEFIRKGKEEKQGKATWSVFKEVSCGQRTQSHRRIHFRMSWALKFLSIHWDEKIRLSGTHLPWNIKRAHPAERVPPQDGADKSAVDVTIALWSFPLLRHWTPWRCVCSTVGCFLSHKSIKMPFWIVFKFSSFPSPLKKKKKSRGRIETSGFVTFIYKFKCLWK